MKSFALDCNIWLSIFFKRKAEKVFTQIVSHQFKIVYCAELLKEFEKIHQQDDKVKKMLPYETIIYTNFIKQSAYLVEVEKRYALLNDYKDNYLVDLAHQSKSTLVSNDKGFDTLKKFHRPPVKLINIKEFYELLEI